MEMGTLAKPPPVDAKVYTDEKSGRRYSFNADTGETRWLNDEEVDASPAEVSVPVRVQVSPNQAALQPATTKPEKKRRMSSRDLIKQHDVETKKKESQIVVPIPMATPTPAPSPPPSL